MSEFHEELEGLLNEWVSGDGTFKVKRYYQGCLKRDGVDLVFTELVDQRRWVTLYLDVYRRSDGAVAGVYYEQPNTEYQEGSEGEPEVVRVREVTRVAYEELA